MKNNCIFLGYQYRLTFFYLSSIIFGVYWLLISYNKLVNYTSVRVDRGALPGGPLKMVINEGRNQKSRSWDGHHNKSCVYIGNRIYIVADIMAKAVTRGNSHWRELGQPLQECEDAILNDKVGLPMARWINTGSQV